MAKKNNQEKRVTNLPNKNANVAQKGEVIYREGMTLLEVANALGKPCSVLIKALMQMGIMANQNQSVERDTLEIVALDLGFELKDEIITDAARFDEMKIVDDEKSLVKRPPIVTIMGHVDHGKTTLLDSIRSSRVALGEAGRITQHIGAYQVKRNGELITFIDTPGHAAFTEMRARGAQITDIVVLVVAADDGIMPQTEEAIAHAKAAKCPIIVAVNKIDLPHANPDKILQELTKYDLVAEEWGGDTPVVKISALKGMGVDELLDTIQFVAEMQELKANPNRLAVGTVIEAKLDGGLGPVATLLVQNGTLKVGDNLACGLTYGKIRTMVDDRNARFQEASPSYAVSVTGLDSVPQAGDKFMVFPDEKTARNVSAERTINAKNASFLASKATSLDDLFKNLEENKELNLLIKCDVQGSAEALKGSIMKIDQSEVKINIVRCSVGTITETDVILAQASKAIIFGFNVRPLANVRSQAKQLGVEIRLHNIIYKALDEIEALIKGLLDPEYEEIVTGQALVQNLFKISKVGTVAGCMVTDGVIERNSKVRVLRNGVVVFEGEMASLKRFKDDAKEVKQGFDCGIMIKDFNDIKEGDVIEGSVMKEKEI